MELYTNEKNISETENKNNVEKEHSYKLTAGKIIFGTSCFILGVIIGENKAVKEIEKRALNSIINNKPIKISKNLKINVFNEEDIK